MTERYARAQFQRYPLGGGHELVVHSFSDRSAVLARADLELLDRCLPWRPLEGHARVAGVDPAMMEPRFRALVGGGWLIAESEVRARLAAASDAARPSSPLVRVGIPTRDRPEALASCIESYTVAARRHGRQLTFVVCDDAPDVERCRDVQARLATLASKLEVEISYAGREHKQQFAAALAARAGVSDELIAFALFGGPFVQPTYGANRNALALASIGERVLCVDDDTRCSLVVPPAARAGLALRRMPDFGWWWFANRDEVRQQAFTDDDLFARHDAVLGREVDECIAGLELAIDDVGLAERISLHGAKPVITLNGLTGDCGAPNPTWLGMVHQGSSLERMAGTKKAFERALSTREILRVVERTSITPPGFLMTTVVGLDHREPLPPFFPVGRGEDGVFSRVLRHCSARWFVGHLPVAVLHDAEGARSLAEVGGPLHVSFAEMLNALLEPPSHRPIARDPIGTMRVIGRELQELAAMSLADFGAAIEAALAPVRARGPAILEARIAECPPAAAYMREELRRRCDAQRETLARHVPIPDEGRGRLRAGVRLYGALLEAWPAILAAAAELRRDGVTLANAGTTSAELK